MNKVKVPATAAHIRHRRGAVGRSGKLFRVLGQQGAALYLRLGDRGEGQDSELRQDVESVLDVGGRTPPTMAALLPLSPV